MADQGGGPDRQDEAPGTPILERVVGAIGAILLLGICGALAWDAIEGDDRAPSFEFRVVEVLPSSGDRHLVRFSVRNVGGQAVEQLAVDARLEARPPEDARLILDFLAAGERREGGFLFTADPAAFPLRFTASSFSEP